MYTISFYNSASSNYMLVFDTCYTGADQISLLNMKWVNCMKLVFNLFMSFFFEPVFMSFHIVCLMS